MEYMIEENIEHIYCLNCNKEIFRGNLKKSKYRARKFCNQKCQMLYQQKEWEKEWIQGKVSGNTNSNWTEVLTRVRTYLFKKYNNKCAKCGWGEINPYTNTIPLEVEHIDGDPYNSTPENLTLLCPNCHSLTATYRGANKGHGRKKTWIPKE